MKQPSSLIPKLGPWIKPVLRRYWLLSRGMTLGVRCAVFDEDGHVFLVRHTYVPGWHLPGGGVEIGETIFQAADKELREEGNIILNEPAELFAVYHNARAYRRDHVALMTARAFTQPEPPRPNAEIAEHGWFDVASLPAETSEATRNRLAELNGNRPISTIW